MPATAPPLEVIPGLDATTTIFRGVNAITEGRGLIDVAVTDWPPERESSAEKRRSEQQRLLDAGEWDGEAEFGYARVLETGEDRLVQMISPVVVERKWWLTESGPGGTFRDMVADALVDALEKAEKWRKDVPVMTPV